MKVTEVMTKSPVCCGPDTNLGAAAEIMLSRNCGFLPMVTPEGDLVGVITDRDMGIALATRNRLPGEVTVQEVSSGTAYSCKSDDDILAALATMAAKGVRRLTVIDSEGKLTGILSTDDVVLHAGGQRHGSLTAEDVVSALRELYDSQLREVKSKAATA